MNRSEFLLDVPSLYTGVSRILCLGGTRSVFNSKEYCDRNAIKSDWDIIGSDIGKVLPYKKASTKNS